MKKMLYLILLTLFSYQISFCQSEGIQAATECSNYNAFYNNENLSSVLQIVHDATPTGGIMIDPNIMENGVTTDSILAAAGVDYGTTFEFTKET